MNRAELSSLTHSPSPSPDLVHQISSQAEIPRDALFSEIFLVLPACLQAREGPQEASLVLVLSCLFPQLPLSSSTACAHFWVVVRTPWT